MFRTAIKSFVGTASLVAATLAVLSSPASAGGAGPTWVKGCQEIAASGSYVLANNIEYTSPDNGICLLITASFVTVDLGGFTISNSGSPGAYGIVGDRVDVFPPPPYPNAIKVFNGAVTGFNLGVSIHPNITGAVVHDVRSIDNSGYGIGVGQGSRVTDNTLIGNGLFGVKATCPSVVSGNVMLNNATDLDLSGVGCVGENAVTTTP